LTIKHIFQNCDKLLTACWCCRGTQLVHSKRPHLTIKQILAWADANCAHNGAARPRANDFSDLLPRYLGAG
jgi:hypothetical protein